MISRLLEMERWAVVVVVGWVLRRGDEGMGERMRQSKRNSEDKMVQSHFMWWSTKHDSWYVASFNNYFLSFSPPPSFFFLTCCSEISDIFSIKDCLGSYIRFLEWKQVNYCKIFLLKLEFENFETFPYLFLKAIWANNV